VTPFIGSGTNNVKGWKSSEKAWYCDKRFPLSDSHITVCSSN